MSAEEKKPSTKKTNTADWFVQGVLTRIGETFDRFTGRGWNPSSNLATSKLIEKLKQLMDSEARDEPQGGVFVPHVLELRMQWDKFSTDSDKSIDALKNELLVAAIDHINDRRYYTYAPLSIGIKTDYFTEGVKFSSSFGEFARENDSEGTLNVTAPDLRKPKITDDGKISVILNRQVVQKKEEEKVYEARFVAQGNPEICLLDFGQRKRITVGRGNENDLVLTDASVSKIHASLALNSMFELVVADTGSTNGTFVRNERIEYGKVASIADGEIVRFGDLSVEFFKVRSAETQIHELESMKPAEILMDNNTKQDERVEKPLDPNAQVSKAIAVQPAVDSEAKTSAADKDNDQDWEI